MLQLNMVRHICTLGAISITTATTGADIYSLTLIPRNVHQMALGTVAVSAVIALTATEVARNPSPRRAYWYMLAAATVLAGDLGAHITGHTLDPSWNGLAVVAVAVLAITGVLTRWLLWPQHIAVELGYRLRTRHDATVAEYRQSTQEDDKEEEA